MTWAMDKFGAKGVTGGKGKRGRVCMTIKIGGLLIRKGGGLVTPQY